MVEALIAACAAALDRLDARAPGRHGQSPGQLAALSVAAQRRSPQTAGHAPQSVGQVAQLSSVLHEPSPQCGAAGSQLAPGGHNKKVALAVENR
jgi:hypothetical protein